MVYFLGRVILAPSSSKVKEILLACAYFVGAEVLFRMTKGGIAYEASKYLVILFMLLGMFFKGISGKGYPYFFYLILLVPSIVVASITLSWTVDFRRAIAFVLSGPVCLGAAALFCYDRKVTHKELMKIMMYFLLPCISTTVYLFLYNPSIKEKLSGTASNFAASGGFGPNQVSTILGLGIFALVVRLFVKSPTVFLKVLNLILLGAMSFRAIITFSRGGVFTTIIAVGAFLVIYYFKSKRRVKNQIIVTLFSLIAVLAITWVVSSNQTLGLIDKRYANQDALGREREDITTGRVELFIEELEGFISNPFLGIGASRAIDKRDEDLGARITSHNELSRLFSEHGVLGLLIMLILVIKPLDYRTKNRKNYYFYAFLAFWFATINHSAMRIAAPAYIYALALLNVVYEKPSVYRKQIEKRES